MVFYSVLYCFIGFCVGFYRVLWFCFSGDFLFLALLRYLLGIIFYFF